MAQALDLSESLKPAPVLRSKLICAVDCVLHDSPKDIPNFELGYTEMLRCAPTPGKGVEAMSSYSAAIGRRFGRPPGLPLSPGLNGFRFASRLAFPGSEFFTASFTVLSERDSTATHRFNTTRGGAYIAVGRGGPITGRGANLLIIDAPQKILTRRAVKPFAEQCITGLFQWPTRH